MDIWRSSDSEWIRAVLRTPSPGQRIVLTGHSLGGALAVLAMYEVLLNGVWRDFTLVTFGSPRVGNIGFVNGFNSAMGGKEVNVWRFVTSALGGVDPVVYLPAYNKGWRHIGNATLLSQDEYESEWGALSTTKDVKGGFVSSARERYFHGTAAYERGVGKGYNVTGEECPAAMEKTSGAKEGSSGMGVTCSILLAALMWGL
jgi:Lipase (class 3)